MTDRILNSLLQSLAAEPPEAAGLLRLADWFAENIEPVAITDRQHQRLPKGFSHSWRRSGCSARFAHPYSFRKHWNRSDIRSAIHRGCEEFGMDHDGTTTVGEHSVFVSEPYGYDDGRATAGCLATRERLGCPVTFAREAAHHPSCVRLIVWHMFPRARSAMPAHPHRVNPSRQSDSDSLPLARECRG